MTTSSLIFLHHVLGLKSGLQHLHLLWYYSPLSFSANLRKAAQPVIHQHAPISPVQVSHFLISSHYHKTQPFQALPQPSPKSPLFQPFEPQILPSILPSNPTPINEPPKPTPSLNPSVDLFGSLWPPSPTQSIPFQPLPVASQSQTPLEVSHPPLFQPIQPLPVQQTPIQAFPQTNEAPPVICFRETPVLAQLPQMFQSSVSIQPHSQLGSLNQGHSQFGNLPLSTSALPTITPNTSGTPTQQPNNQFDFVQLF